MTPQQPYPQPGVWPPPPSNTVYGETFPFQTVFSRVLGSVPDFRVGALTVSPDGIVIQGKAVPRYEIQVPIMIVCLVLGAGWLIAYLIMEYAVRQNAMLTVPWETVRQIVVVGRKRRACLVYDAPNYKGVVKTFSLTTNFAPGEYESFLRAVEQFAPGRIAEGKLRTWTSPVAWVVLVAIVVLIGFIAVSAAMGGTAHSS